MSMALQELKLLLLSKTVKALGTVEQTRPIMNALQSLLKVAEMRNKCCFFDDCAHPALALQNKFSLNISLENDRILLLTGRGKSNGTSANELYGHSDGDTTDTDNSYATADEGYDVSTFNIHAHGELAFCLCSSYQAKTILKICDQINVTHFDGI